MKAEGYGHGAVDVSRAALDAGATALCVATLPEALHLRAALRNARILVMGPVSEREIGEAGRRDSSWSRPTSGSPKACASTSSSTPAWAGGALAELPAPTRDVVGLMSHLASAESDPAFTQLQVARFREATAGLGSLTRHLANSAAALRFAEARFDAVRCGIALYGISPFGVGSGRRRSRAGPALGVVRRSRQEARAGGEHGLRAALRRRSRDVDRSRPGRICGRLPSRHDGHRRARRGRASSRRRDDLDGRARRRARRRRSTRALRSRSSATACSSRSTRVSPARSRTRSRPG